MPLYDFSCPTCGAHFEKHLSFSDTLTSVACPNGHLNAQRVYTAPMVQFKGSGWYVTDSRKNNSASAANESGN